jgi:ABC-type Fe3+/spermidine/putrescine transport system ATPase subunit
MSFGTGSNDSPQKQPFFCARHLRKNWESLCVDFSLEAEKGSMTAIVGPSGCGKSTALNLIAGLTPVDAPPTLTLDGKDIARLPPGKRGISMVFQTPALFSHLPLADNIAYGLRCRGVSVKECRFRAAHWLDKIGLAGFEKRFPDTLSGGEAQRVSLARALIVEPRLLLFDEPFSSLDAPLKQRLIQEIAALKAETGFTGIIVTHDITEARALCGRIASMENGSVVKIENI